MPEKTKVVRVVPYDPEWKNEFNKLKKWFTKHLGDLILKVEHVGSTSVENLAAKPIIDLDIVIENYVILPNIIKELECLGYEHQGDLGIEGREAFKIVEENNFMKHHLYVCPVQSKAYQEHIALRDYLRQNEDKKMEYAALKKKLAEQYRYDVDTYCEEKSDFIKGILNKTLYK